MNSCIRNGKVMGRILQQSIYLMLVATLISCSLRKGVKEKEYQASYRYTYTDTTTQGDSVLIVGRVIDPLAKYQDVHTIIVSFRAGQFSEDAEQEYVRCDTAGNFRIKLRKDTYEVYASHPLSEANFWIFGLGQGGNIVQMEIQMQIKQRMID